MPQDSPTSLSSSGVSLKSLPGVPDTSMLQRCVTIEKGATNILLSTLARPRDRISIRTDGKIVILKYVDIYYLRAAGNYIEIHVSGQKYLIRDTMSKMQKRLPDSVFVRIHRSVIINIDHISEIMTWYNGELKISLTNGKGLIVSRKYRSNIEALLELI
jgi:DNA-binding LytR/AlgR family response regulator